MWERSVEERINSFAKAQSAEKIKLAQDKQKIISDLKAKKDDLAGLKNLLASTSAFVDIILPPRNRTAG
jgi:hypothetical protein